MNGDAEAVRAHVEAALPAPATWTDPTGYRDSLAMCVIDSVFFLRASYSSTVCVLDRYRAVRRAAGGDPDRDRLTDLLAGVRFRGPATSSRTRIEERANRTSVHTLNRSRKVAPAAPSWSP